LNEDELKTLEEFLLPYALKRFSYDSYQTNFPLAKMAQSMAKGLMGDFLNEYVTWMVRAFVRCLFSISNEIYLKDLAAITLAEGSYMAQIGPWGPFAMRHGTTSPDGRESMEVTLEAEVHAWLLHLQDNNKLPGVYERFTGRYFLN